MAEKKREAGRGGAAGNLHFVKSCKRRLCQERGETIAETLVALLIGALALVMLAGAISASAQLIERSKEKMGDYYDAHEVMVQMPTDLGSDSQVVSSTGEICFTDTTGSSTRALAIEDQAIIYYQNQVFGETSPITMYVLEDSTSEG